MIFFNRSVSSHTAIKHNPKPRNRRESPPILSRTCRTAENLQKRSWAEKESFGDYVAQRIPSLTKYMNSLGRTHDEEITLQRIKSEFLKMIGTQPDVFPFKPSLSGTNWVKENSNSNLLTERQIKLYSEDGVLGPIAIKTLSSSILKSVFAQYTGITKTLGTKGYRDVRVRQEWVSPEILDIACNPEIVSRVSSLLGADIKIRFTGIHEVPPKTGGFSAATDDKIASLCAHSDMNLGARLSKLGLNGPLVDTDSINVWVSITHAHQHNAPLFLFPKTHNWPILTPLKYLNHTKEDPTLLQWTFKLLTTKEFGSEIVANHALFYHYLQTSLLREELPKIKRREFYTNPGECLIFSTHLQHGSDINHTDKPRLGISIRYSRATNKENTDTTRLVNSLFSKTEKTRLGIDENESRAPILQILGTQHHENSIPINHEELRKILVEKKQQINLSS